MKALLWVYGWPHELLHLAGLWLVGRRAVRITRTHIDIPADLSAAQYVLVAGLPALVFWGLTLWSIQQLFAAPDVGRTLLWLALAAFWGIGALGTVGDVLLIIERLIQGRPRPPLDETDTRRKL